MTPGRDNDEYSANRLRQQPLPLCLSDNEKNMPILTVITTEENSNANVRPPLILSKISSIKSFFLSFGRNVFTMMKTVNTIDQ